MTLLFIVGSGITLVALVGGAVGALSEQRESRQSAAARTWRDITLRNGVTAESPWHKRESSFNAPGLVRVYPHSQRPHIPESELIHTHTPQPSVQTARPAPVSIENPVIETDSADSAAPKLPIELADEANETERAAVLRLHAEGKSQTAVILEAWAIKSGGSKKYKLARERYQQYLSESVNV